MKASIPAFILIVANLLACSDDPGVGLPPGEGPSAHAQTPPPGSNQAAASWADAAAAAADGSLVHAPMGPPAWTLDGESSYLSLISVKQTDIAEVHTFDSFSGIIDQYGEANLTVDLSSIATNVEVRDQRLRDFLFDVVRFPAANARLKLDMVTIEGISVGSSAEVPVSTSFNLRGKTKTLEVVLVVMRLSDEHLMVKTARPIVLDTKDYDLQPGVQKLLELTGLQSISSAVPVEFMFDFKRVGGSSSIAN